LRLNTTEHTIDHITRRARVARSSGAKDELEHLRQRRDQLGLLRRDGLRVSYGLRRAPRSPLPIAASPWTPISCGGLVRGGARLDLWTDGAPVRWAIARGRTEIARILAEAGAPPEEPP